VRVLRALPVSQWALSVGLCLAPPFGVALALWLMLIVFMEEVTFGRFMPPVPELRFALEWYATLVLGSVVYLRFRFSRFAVGAYALLAAYFVGGSYVNQWLPTWLRRGLDTGIPVALLIASRWGVHRLVSGSSAAYRERA